MPSHADNVRFLEAVCSLRSTPLLGMRDSGTTHFALKYHRIYHPVCGAPVDSTGAIVECLPAARITWPRLAKICDACMSHLLAGDLDE